MGGFTNSRKKHAADNMPPCRFGVAFRKSATGDFTASANSSGSGIAHAAPVQQPRTEPGIRIVAGVSAPRDRIPAAGRPATTAGVTAPRQRVDATVAGAPGNNREGTKEIPE